MSRKSFQTLAALPISELRLDPHNARIRSASDERDCIAKIAKKQDQLVNLMRDIAKEGLGTASILVQPLEDGTFLVWDGNRRTTVLKLLQNPDLAPNPILRAEASKLAKAYPGNVLDEVDCLACNDTRVLFREVVKRHAGALAGVGQLSWETYLRSVYQLTHDEATDNKRAAQYLLFGEQHGLLVEDDFPITNITRFLTQENLKSLGFDVINDELSPSIDPQKSLAMLSTVVSDFQLKKHSVASVFTVDGAREYIDGVRKACGLPSLKPAEDRNNRSSNGAERNGGESDDPTRKGSDGDAYRNTPRGQGSEDEGTGGRPDSESDADPAGEASGAKSGGRQSGGRTPRKPSSERDTLFIRNRPGFVLPPDQLKAGNIIAELKVLRVGGEKATRIAVSMLLRSLIETAVDFYAAAHGITETEFPKKIRKTAESMHARGLLSDDQLENVKRRTMDQRDMLHAATLHKFVHSAHFSPTRDGLNTMWEEFSTVVAQCWS